MISNEELSRSLHGTIRLAKGDPSGIQAFNATLEGFWNSVTAAAIVLPGFAFMTWLGYLVVPAEASSERIIVVEGIGFVVQWTAFQLALFYYCQAVGKADRFFHAAVSLNWIDVPIIAAHVGLALLVLAGLPGSIGGLLNLILMILVVAYATFVAKAALRCTIPVAIGPVAIGFVLAGIVDFATARMTGQG
ncbi:MAG: hypothetical protein ACFCVH_15535 [Alphaproteobacteria bacterium]